MNKAVLSVVSVRMNGPQKELRKESYDCVGIQGAFRNELVRLHVGR